MKPEKKKIREGDHMPLSPKGKRAARRVSRQNDRAKCRDHLGYYIVRTGTREDDDGRA